MADLRLLQSRRAWHLGKAHYALLRLRVWQLGERTARHWRNNLALKRAQAEVYKWEGIFHQEEREVRRYDLAIAAIERKPVTMYDSIEVSAIPGHAQAVAGYVGGKWPTFGSLVQQFPEAKRLSIAISASEDAECLDVETGDASPSQAPAWVRRQHARGIRRPVLYANLSTMPQVLAALHTAGIPRSQYRLWTAHYTGTPHLEEGSDATQWTERGLGRNLDISLCRSDFFD